MICNEMKVKTTANSTYKKLAVQWLNEALSFVSTSAVADSFRLRNRQLLVAAKRWQQAKNRTRQENMNSRTIEKNIGKPTKIDWKKPKAIGSSSFYLKSFIAKNNSAEFIKENSKCSFEKFSDGILLRSNLSNKTSELTIKESEIVYIKLIRGKESVEPLTLSPMWIMLKLGVSKLTARYFRIVLGEYSIDEMKLKIETENHIMEFTQNGYIFERQLSFFKNLNYGEKLIIEMSE